MGEIQGSPALHRTNPMGLKYTLHKVGEATLVSLDGTGKNMTIPVHIDVISQAWYKWQMMGKMVQEAFNFLNPEQREFLITGITPSQWNEIFKDSEE